MELKRHRHVEDGEVCDASGSSRCCSGLMCGSLLFILVLFVCRVANV